MTAIIVGVENARIQFTMRIADGASPPELIRLSDGTLLIRVGRYASPGNQYCYRAAVPVDVDAEPREWPEFSGLKGSAP